MRAGSSQSSADIGRIQPGEEFDVIGGPVCNGRYKMWQVRTNSGQTGWTAEGDAGTYWIGQVTGSASHNRSLGRNCEDNGNGTVSCWAVGVRRSDENNGDDPYIGVLELPNGAESRIQSVRFDTVTGIDLRCSGHCGGVDQFVDANSGSTWIPLPNFQLVQGCVRGIDLVRGGRDNPGRWTMTYRK